MAKKTAKKTKKKAGRAAKKTTRKAAKKKSSKKTTRKASSAGFSRLETNILLAKGLDENDLKRLKEAGVACRADFRTVADATTLSQLTNISANVAAAVMSWALGVTVNTGGNVIVESADVVNCVHCRTKQPKDYKSGDLCTACGKQAEPIQTCFWCATSGPGKYCRHCAAEFVPTGELELAVLLKREGLAKDQIPGRLQEMNKEEKDQLWGRIRRHRA
jgi:hypothetical protein